MTETRFQEIKRYTRLDERDSELLRAFGAMAAAELPRIALEFYDRIREHQDAHAVFTGEDQIQRLQRSLVAWLARVCGGVYDEAYHEQTSIIGRVHVKIGLPQRYMLTAMALIRVALLRIADQKLGAEAGATREALARILDVELAVMLEAYKDSYVERIEQAARDERDELRSRPRPSRRRYVNADELTGVIVIGLDQEGRICLFNSEAERVTGHSRDEVMGAPFVEVLGVEDEHLIQMLNRGLRSEAEFQTVEACIRTRVGKLRSVVWNLSGAIDGGDDEVVLVVGGRDVTDQRVKDERARQNERLAAIGTLAAGLAHEIRNPLNGAQLHVSYLERAIKKVSDPQVLLDATRVVGGEITRLAHLVTEFLDFARPSAPKLTPTSLIQTVKQAHALAAPAADAANVRLECDPPTSDVEFPADAARLSQVLVNLLNNAVEATGATGGGGSVLLRGRRGPHSVLIDVEDNGPGLMTPDEPIFDAFYSSKPGGTGLGLSISHRIIADHGGSLDVSSRAGKTTFRITLPLENHVEARR